MLTHANFSVMIRLVNMVLQSVFTRPRSHLPCTRRRFVAPRPMALDFFTVHAADSRNEVKRKLVVAFVFMRTKMEFGDSVTEIVAHRKFELDMWGKLREARRQMYPPLAGDIV